MSSEGEGKQKNTLIIALLAVLSILLLIWIILSVRSTALVRETEQGIEALLAMESDELTNEKLRQEIRNLIIENNQLVSPWQQISSYATVFTVIVAIIGAFTTIWKQFSEQQRDRAQREAESMRRLDEKFSSLVQDLGADNTSLKVSAVVSLLTFLKEEYAQFHEQVYLVLLANLKIKQDLQVNRLLIRAFEEALRLKLEKGPPSESLDLTHTCLYHADLSKLDLTAADMAFADLESASLRGTKLFRLKGFQTKFTKATFTDANLGEARLNEAIMEFAHLHNANLVAADLKETNLKCAQFYGAKLQSAHLEGADLRGACFEQANLDDTYFYEAVLDSQALRSIVKAYQWPMAHFDEKIKEKLKALSQA